MELKNAVVVITGGTSRIGLCVIKKLLSSCDVKYVAVFELDLPECRNVFSDLQKEYNERIGFYPCDVTVTSLIGDNFDKVIASHGTIDILINNAGVATESSPEKMIDTNFKALAVGSYMLIDRIGKHKSGKGGLIVNMGSILSFVNFRKAPIYSATKHAVVSFTHSLKESYDVTGVSVVAICPGLPNILSFSAGKHLPDFLEKSANYDIRYMCESPEDVASAVVGIIKHGQAGDVWVSENGESPYSVEELLDLRCASEKIAKYI